MCHAMAFGPVGKTAFAYMLTINIRFHARAVEPLAGGLVSVLCMRCVRLRLLLCVGDDCGLH
jgi:hypothetical protein